MATTMRLTSKQFLEWEGNERHVQLIDGEVVVNSPVLRHQTLVVAICAELRAWTLADPGRRGKVAIEVDTRLDERSRRRARGFDVALELGRGEKLTPPQLPGFALDLTALFDEA